MRGRGVVYCDVGGDSMLYCEGRGGVVVRVGGVTYVTRGCPGMCREVSIASSHEGSDYNTCMYIH